nr:hypothetical protein [Saprospiraceae bacterium]
ILLIYCVSCTSDTLYNDCKYDDLVGNYLFYSGKDTSDCKIQIKKSDDGFKLEGLCGSKFWYPSAPLTGSLNGCDIIINSYSNVKKMGLNTPGGSPRCYYENLSGNGRFYPENDSIKLYIHYSRTEYWFVNFEGNIFLKKIN